MIPHMKFKNKLKQSKVFKVMAAVTLEGVGGWVSRTKISGIELARN